MLGWGLVTGLNPVRLGLTLLVISRPRPMQNLLAYWIGCLTASITAVVVPLTLLHATPAFKSFADDIATSSILRHIRVGVGVLVLAIAALLTVRSLTRWRRQARSPAPSESKSTLVLNSDTSTAVSRLLTRTDNAAREGAEGKSAIRRLLRRVHNAWEDGSLWVAFFIGIAFGGVEPDVVIVVLAITLASGAAIGAQVSAAIAFIIGILAVVEITLASYLAVPAKTQAMVQRLHDWAQVHRRKILVAMCTVGGVSLVAYGMGAA